jgi:hypothetical protein
MARQGSFDSGAKSAPALKMAKFRGEIERMRAEGLPSLKG